MLKKNQYASSTALRVLSVLEYLAELGQPVTVSDVCNGTGLDRPTAYRTLLTLVEGGYALRDATAKTFRLSYKIVTLARAMMSSASHVEAVRAAMRNVVAATGETCHYSVLEGFETVTTQREKGSQIVSVEFKIGDREQLHCTSIGKALLAFQGAEFIEGYLGRPLPRRTPRTICKPAALRHELARVRAAGLATDDNEMIEGMRCVAVPILEADGVVRSGFSISGPASRFTDEHIGQLGQVLIKCAGELAREMGY